MGNHWYQKASLPAAWKNSCFVPTTKMAIKSVDLSNAPVLLLEHYADALEEITTIVTNMSVRLNENMPLSFYDAQVDTEQFDAINIINTAFNPNNTDVLYQALLGLSSQIKLVISEDKIQDVHAEDVNEKINLYQLPSYINQMLQILSSVDNLAESFYVLSDEYVTDYYSGYIEVDNLKRLGQIESDIYFEFMKLIDIINQLNVSLSKRSINLSRFEDRFNAMVFDLPNMDDTQEIPELQLNVEDTLTNSFETELNDEDTSDVFVETYDEEGNDNFIPTEEMQLLSSDQIDGNDDIIVSDDLVAGDYYKAHDSFKTTAIKHNMSIGQLNKAFDTVYKRIMSVDGAWIYSSPISSGISTTELNALVEEGLLKQDGARITLSRQGYQWPQIFNYGANAKPRSGSLFG